MPVILSLETSTDVCSVALHDNRKLLGERVIREPQSHASMLAPLIQQMVGDSHLTMAELDAVAVSKGPGSYTGLRIGTSTAKGLCYALDIPLMAVGTLELMAYQGKMVSPQKGALLCPMIDARRMEVYCLIADADLNIVEPVSAKIVEAGSFAELLQDRAMLFFGNGAKKCREIIRHPNAIFLDVLTPLASFLGEMAGKKFTAGEFEDVAQFKPFYLKEFVAKKAGAGR